MHYKKKVQCGFEPVKMHWIFYRFTNAFQMIFDALKTSFVMKVVLYWILITTINKRTEISK